MREEFERTTNEPAAPDTDDDGCFEARPYAVEPKRAQEELERFAYILSHDLQEPLRMVTSYCELLQRRYDHQLDPAGQEFIRHAVDGARQMGGKINGLLDYSRVISCREPFSLVDVTDAMLAAQIRLAAVVRRTGAVVHLSELPTIRGNRPQLVQAFYNLLDNALKFVHRDRTPEIRVSARDDGGACEIFFEDNGIGIDPKYRDRIFDIFHRLNARDAYTGLGLGLTLCRRIFEGHGGSIELDASETGSRFVIRLPVP